MDTPFNKKLEAIPKVHQGFGEDGGIFYKYYDDLADELDDDMVTSLKSQLDGILIFAGLFAGVNSAFLAFTLPQMSPDPTDDTNALLFQIMLGGNRTIKSPADLPSASFSPTARTYTINVLFSVSLTLALLGSFIAVLGQQWLVYYRKRSGGGAEYQRWEQLRRYLGAKRWRLELVLDDVLPGVLQVALVIFFVAFIFYLGTLSTSLCYAIAAPVCAAGAIIVMTALCAAWDHWCPFKSPLSHLIQPLLKHSVDAVGRVVGISVSLVFATMRWLVHRFRHEEAPFASSRGVVPDRARSIAKWFKHHGQRPADATDQLKVVALKRVLCTSEDPNAITHAATNTQSISQNQLLGQILNDDELRSRFEALDTISFSSVMWHNTESVTIQNTAIARSLLHMVLMAGSVEDFLHYEDRSLLKGWANDPEYSTELMEMLHRRFASFLVMDMFPMDNEYAECSHCIALGYCMQLIRVIPEMSRPELIRIQPEHLERPIRVVGASKEVGPAWIEAWAIRMSKEWDELAGGEAKLTPNSDVRSWQLEKLREFLRLYQNMDGLKFVQTISEAIATSSVQWCSQPEPEVYVRLFEQDLLFRSDTKSFGYSLGLTLRSLVTLLHSFERRIRGPATSSDERESYRKQRRACTDKWISYVESTYNLNGNSFMHEERIVLHNGPLWYHCIEASDTLQPYLQWMADIIKADPGDADNPSMIKMVTFLFGCLTDPEESMLQLERVELAYMSLGDKIEEGKLEEYRQFYPVFAKTVRDIESSVAAAIPCSSEVENLETQSRHDTLWRQGKPSKTPLEWWGN